MKIKKIVSGVAAVCAASAMAVSASAETVFELENPQTGEWQGAFEMYVPEGFESLTDDFIDSRSLTPDTPLEITINFEWVDSAKDAADHFCAVAPVYANGWAKLYETHPEWVITDLPAKEDLTEGNDDTGHHRFDKDGNIVSAAVQADGFFQAYEEDCTSFTITLTEDFVNDIIDTSDLTPTPSGEIYDGIVFQVGNHGMKITSIECSQDGLKLASTMEPEIIEGYGEEEKSSEADTAEAEVSEDKTAEDETAEPDSTAAVSSADESKADEDEGTSTGLIVGICAAVVAVAAVIIGFAVKGKKNK